MNTHYAIATQRMIDGTLTCPGDTDPTLRRWVQDLATELVSGSSTQTAHGPSELVPYIKKVALHSYKITDGDIEALRQHGYSEEAIFEITVCAAYGAAMVVLECGLAALKGER